MGVQTQRGGAALQSMVRSTWPTTIKCIDQVDRGLVQEWRERRPDGLLVLRRFFPTEELRDEKVDDLLRWADEVRTLGPILEVPINEAHQRGDDLKRFADWSAAAARRIAAAGYKPVVGNFSEGNPPHLAEWPFFFPALQAARELGGYLGLHEYFTPGCYLDSWHSLRYRRVWPLLPESLRVPLLITECGIDGGIDAPDGNRPKSGWRAYVDAREYARLLRGYRDELAKDAHVHGAHVFGCAMFDDWESFDVRDEGDLRPIFAEAVAGPPRWRPEASRRPAMIDQRGRLPTLAGGWSVLEYNERPLDSVHGVTLHFTGGPTERSARDIAAYQISEAAIVHTGLGQPYPAIAFTLLVTGDGAVNLCHDLDRRTWHSAARPNGLSRNLTHIGICYTGSVEPNGPQIAGLAEAIDWCERQLNRQLTIEGHRDPPLDIACPGPRWPEWRQPLERELARLRQSRPVDVGNGFTIRAEFRRFLEQHPEWGRPRMNELPLEGGAYLWLTPTPEHPRGGLLLYRAWLKEVRPVAWE
jgi:hypothetical protein